MYNDTQTNISQKSITLKGLITTCISHWRLLVPIVLICFMASVIYSAFIVTPMYDSNAKLYIINKASASNQMTSTDFNISTYLANDFKEILVDDVILNEVSKELDNKYSTGYLRKAISVNAPEDTRIIKIQVSTPSAEDSKRIADSICKISSEKLTEIMGLDRIKVIRNGSLSKAPSSPNLTADAVKGLIAGIIIAVGVAILILFLDNKISSSEDVEKILGLSVLTSIPYNQTKPKKK